MSARNGSNGVSARAGSMALKDQPILLIADSTLKTRALGTFERHGIRNVTVLHDPVDRFSRPKHETPEARQLRRAALRQAKQEAGELILSQRWGAIVSHYQEFIFLKEHLATTELPLNIHPSCPSIPGMGYDVLPLIEDSATFGKQGATLHFITEGIDEGAVISVLSHELDPKIEDYSTVRQKNQELCMEQLEWLCSLLAEAASSERLKRYLRGYVQSLGVQWGRYVTAKERDELLFALHVQCPNHPALRGNTKFQKALAWKDVGSPELAESSTPEITTAASSLA